MTLRPAEFLKLPQGRLAKGAPADIILFDIGAPFRLDSDKLRSKSNNSPFDEKTAARRRQTDIHRRQDGLQPLKETQMSVTHAHHSSSRTGAGVDMRVCHSLCRRVRCAGCLRLRLRRPGDRGPARRRCPLTARSRIAAADGTQLMVDFENNQARIAIVGGPSMVLPSAGPGYYSNGRYGFRGGGASGQWEVGRAAPVSCSGG